MRPLVILILSIPSIACADPRCATVCARLLACTGLGAKQKRPVDECARSCDEQVAASRVVSEQVEKIVAQCIPARACDQLADCIKHVPARLTRRGIELLTLPLPPEVADRWLSLECAATREYGDRLAQMAYLPTPPPELRTLAALSKLIQAIDATALATLTEVAWQKCAKKRR